MPRIDYEVTVDATKRGHDGFAQLEGDLNKVTKGFNRGTSLGIEFNRVIQDSAYFARSSSMGFMAVTNNVQQLVDRFTYARAAGESFTGMLKSTFSGFNLVSLALNTAISGFLAYSIASENAQTVTKSWDLKTLIGEVNAYAESIAKVKKEISALADVDIGKVVGEINKKISETLRKQLLAMKAQAVIAQQAGPSAGFAGLILNAVFGKPEDYDLALKMLNDTLDVANDEIVKRITNNKSWDFWDARVRELTDKIRAGDMSLIGDLKKARAELQKIEDIINPKEKKTKGRLNFRIEEMPPYFADDVAAKSFNNLQNSFKRMGVWDDTHKAIALALTIDTQPALSKSHLGAIKIPAEPVFYRGLKNYDIEQAKKDFPQATILANAVGSAITDSGVEAFRNIFGEANSLFEQFLENVVAGFMRLAEMEIATWLFKTVLSFAGAGASGGIGAGFTASDYASGVPIPKMSGGGGKETMVVNLNVGNQTIGHVVAEGYNLSVRRRYLN